MKDGRTSVGRTVINQDDLDAIAGAESSASLKQQRQVIRLVVARNNNPEFGWSHI
jgi:hypothetical protein